MSTQELREMCKDYSIGIDIQMTAEIMAITVNKDGIKAAKQISSQDMELTSVSEEVVIKETILQLLREIESKTI